MKKVVRIRKGRKVKVMPAQVLRTVLGDGDVDSVVEVIQALIPLGLAAVEDALSWAVRRLAGKRYQRTGRPLRQVRWGKQPGSVYLWDQKMPVEVPRVRDRLAGREIPLETYAQLGVPRQGDIGLLRRILLGLSARRYGECAEAVPEAFGLSPSTVSRRFIRASARKLQQLAERRLDREDVVALFLDGKTFTEDALEQATYAEAKAALGALQRELRRVNLSAAERLAEGLEDTLTLHRLGLFPQLGRSLKTTNCIESLLAQVGQRTDKVDRWVTSEQKHRWVATALLDIEPRLRRVRGYRFLPQLRAALAAYQHEQRQPREVA